ncbi:MAG TPA: DcaP family trimeric outer membrane transporter [Puia sp.]|jgi:hypothetical protein|nr:DcaP family trimeric outer membrane transporter [Puia sp.]
MCLKLRATLALLFLFSLSRSFAQDQSTDTSLIKTFEIYGFAMADFGYNTKQINPAWFDALRVTRLPTYKNQYAPDGTFYASIRQTRFGVRGWTPTPIGNLKAVFEFDMFGVGGDEGQTTMRPRHMYGELGRFLLGQTNTPFMDGDVFPNTVEYWGPTGIVFFRNIQLRFAAMQGDNELFFALERPGASADAGTEAGRIELDSIVPKLELPDVSAHYKKSGSWGHIQIAGMLRDIKWKDIHESGGYDLSGSVLGWGLHLSTVLNLGKMNVFRGSIVHGEGVENYMNDAPFDVGVEVDSTDPQKPLKGKALPVTGWSAYLEHNWSPVWQTVIGYSATHIENTTQGSTTAYKDGQYGTITMVATPFTNFMAAVEAEYGKRANFGNDFTSDALKIQVSFKYTFSQSFYSRRK